jgi:membrane protease YdiL (CAAX protease family)
LQKKIKISLTDMERYFWNEAEDRLRAAWRILIQVTLVAFPLAILGASGFYSSQDSMATRVALTALPVVVLSIFIMGRYVDKRKFSDFGLQLGQKQWWADYGFGFLTGMTVATLYIFLLKFLGWAEFPSLRILRPEGTSLATAFLISILTYAAVGVFEELMRAYQIRNITEGLVQTRLRLLGATFIAVSLAGVWSVLAHVASGDPLFLAYIFITSVIYGLFFPWTERVALAMAVHFAWDFTLSSIFLLGAEGDQATALFVVALTDAPVIGSNLLPALGIVAKILLLILVRGWIRRNEGQIIIHGELALPSLVARGVDAA